MAALQSRSGDAIRRNYTSLLSRYVGRTRSLQGQREAANAGVQLRSDQTDRRVVTRLAARLASRNRYRRVMASLL